MEKLVRFVDPKTGHLNWKTHVGNGGLLGGIEWGLATDGIRIYRRRRRRHICRHHLDAPGLRHLITAGGRCGLLRRRVHRAAGRRFRVLNGISAPPTAVRDVVFAGDMIGRLRRIPRGAVKPWADRYRSSHDHHGQWGSPDRRKHRRRGRPSRGGRHALRDLRILRLSRWTADERSSCILTLTHR